MSVDPLEGPSELFEKILGDISEEQWETYKEQTMHSGLIVDSDSEEDSYCDDSRTSSPLVPEENITEIEVVRQNSDSEVEVSAVEEEEEPQETNLSWDCDIALKYINGEIKFSDLENMISKRPSKYFKDAADDVAEQVETSDMEKDNHECEKEVEKKRVKKKRRKMAGDLPKDLEGLMGRANLNFANGNHDVALKICTELIRLAPRAYKPFQLLGQIYEEQGDEEKSLQCSLAAAYLHPVDTEEWARLAEILTNKGQIQQAISCYSKALKNDPTNVTFLWDRCNLYERLGEKKKALAGYEQILQNLDQIDGETNTEMSREIARIYTEDQDYSNASQVLDRAFAKFPSWIRSEDVNLLLELLLNLKSYKQGIKVLVQHCGVRFNVDTNKIASFEEVLNLTDEQMKEIYECNVPDILPIDLFVKLMICFIHVKALKAVDELLISLKQENQEEVGDLFLDVAEAFMETGEHGYAKPLLFSLVNSANYNLAAVWLRFGDCLNALNETTSAIEAYKVAVAKAPAHHQARLSLSQLFLKLGSESDAALWLKQDFEDGKEDTIVDLLVLYERCKLLSAQECWDEFITAGILAQFSHCQRVKSSEEFSVVLSNQSARRRCDALKELSPLVSTPQPVFANATIPAEDLWSLFQKVCQKLFEFKRLEQLQNLSICALTSKKFYRLLGKSKDLEFLALLCCFYNGNNKYAYILVKDLVLKNMNNARAWNFFCLVITRSQDIRHNRFCLRLTMKNQDHLALGLLNGHNALVSGSYKHALAEYISILEDRPDDYLVSFCVGLTYIHMASQKFSSKRFYLAIQGMRYLQQYLKLRGTNQETFYNIGRAMHQLGLFDLAVFYYKSALNLPPAITSGPDKDLFDLSKEIAYNLCLIYEESGAHDLAYIYTRRYIII